MPCRMNKTKIRIIPSESLLLLIHLRIITSSQQSMTLFRIMELQDGFFAVDPDLWEDRDDYKKAAKIVENLKVVNDHAERGVALIQEYSGILTHDESQLQFLLQVSEDHRKMYPDSRKQTLSRLP